MKLGPFRQKLSAWFEAAHRDLPWRRTRDPYRIWLSETMLQQTRAATAVPYYERFLERYPDVKSLAGASEPEVLAAWSGLGYYHRARNLHRAARKIEQEGSFPSAYEELRALPGVGDYTAAAVGSIAFNLQCAVLDGNVLRVIARLTADGGDIASGKTRRRFQAAADQWLDPKQPGAFNQAMMELGATVCLPRNPLCLLCPVAALCESRAAGTQALFPVKTPKPAVKTAESELILVERAGAVLMRQRPAYSPRMAGFWELPERMDFPRSRALEIGSFSHTIVNTRWTVRVFRTEGAGPKRVPSGMRWLEKTDFVNLPVTTVTKKALAIVAAFPAPETITAQPVS